MILTYTVLAFLSLLQLWLRETLMASGSEDLADRNTDDSSITRGNKDEEEEKEEGEWGRRRRRRRRRRELGR